MVICVTSFDKLRRHLMVTVLSSYWNWRSPERLINNRLRHVISSQQTISKRLSVDTQKKSIEWENPLINLPAGCRPIRRWARDGVPSNMKEPIAIRTLNHWIDAKFAVRFGRRKLHVIWSRSVPQLRDIWQAFGHRFVGRPLFASIKSNCRRNWGQI